MTTKTDTSIPPEWLATEDARPLSFRHLSVDEDGAGNSGR